jgi:hypothetical protein
MKLLGYSANTVQKVSGSRLVGSNEDFPHVFPFPHL